MSTALRAWMAEHTGPQQAALAHRAGTSRAYLYRAASGKHAMSLDLAIRLERASHGELPRDKLLGECGACPLRRKCVGAS